MWSRRGTIWPSRSRPPRSPARRAHSPTSLRRSTGCAATDLLLLERQSLDIIYPEPLAELEGRQVGVYRRITPSDTLLGLQRTRQIGGMPFVALRAHALPACRLRFKRLLDLVYLLVLAPFAIPLTLAVALYVRLRAGRGVLYRQERGGHGGPDVRHGEVPDHDAGRRAGRAGAGRRRRPQGYRRRGLAPADPAR